MDPFEIQKVLILDICRQCFFKGAESLFNAVEVIGENNPDPKRLDQFLKDSWTELSATLEISLIKSNKSPDELLKGRKKRAN